MTTIYFVRHALPDFPPGVPDGERSLKAEGLRDRAIVLDFLRDKPVDGFYCSPYRRSLETIAPAAEFFRMEIATDFRLRERTHGPNGNNIPMFRRRWADFDYQEPGGECLRSVQERNIAALRDILARNEGKTLVLGTHGTALSTILNHYYPSWGLEAFLRVKDWMPWIEEARFEGDGMVLHRERG